MAGSLIADEYPIGLIPDIKYWSENFLLVFTDPASGLGGFLSIGRWVLNPEIWRSMCYVTLPDGRIICSRNYAKDSNSRNPNSGVFNLEIIDPGRRFGYHFNGPADEQTQIDLNVGRYSPASNKPLQFDLEFDSEQPIWDMHAASSFQGSFDNPNQNFNSPDGHIEQNGFVRGVVQFDSQVFHIAHAAATRDHSRGARNFAPYHTHIWANGIMENGSSFNIFVMKSAHGQTVGCAAYTSNNRQYNAALNVGSEGWLLKPDKLFDSFTFALDVEGLGCKEIYCRRIVNSVPLMLVMPADHHWGVPDDRFPTETTWISEQKVEWSYGDIKGYGHLERGNRTFSISDPRWLVNFP